MLYYKLNNVLYFRDIKKIFEVGHLAKSMKDLKRIETK